MEEKNREIGNGRDCEPFPANCQASVALDMVDVEVISILSYRAAAVLWVYKDAAIFMSVSVNEQAARWWVDESLSTRSPSAIFITEYFHPCHSAM